MQCEHPNILGNRTPFSLSDDMIRVTFARAYKKAMAHLPRRWKVPQSINILVEIVIRQNVPTRLSISLILEVFAMSSYIFHEDFDQDLISAMLMSEAVAVPSFSVPHETDSPVAVLPVSPLAWSLIQLRRTPHLAVMGCVRTLTDLVLG